MNLHKVNRILSFLKRLDNTLNENLSKFRVPLPKKLRSRLTKWQERDSAISNFLKGNYKPKESSLLYKVQSLDNRLNQVAQDSLKAAIDKGKKWVESKSWYQRLQDRRSKSFSKLRKASSRIKKFDSTLNDWLSGKSKPESVQEIESSPAYQVTGTVAVVVGAIALEKSVSAKASVSVSGSIFPLFYSSPQIPDYTGAIETDWTSYKVDVNGIKYARSTVSGAAINNPMNLRPPKSSYYEGQVGRKEVFRKSGQSVGYFAVFSDPYYSFKAANRQILRYRDSDTWAQRRRALGASTGKLTAFQMLNIYAPPKDANNPSSYANQVMKYSEGRIKPDDLLKIDTDKEQFKYLIRAMARVENAAYVDLDYLDKVWESIYGNGVAPLQSVLNASKQPTEYSQTSSKTSRNEGFSNKQSTGNQSANVQHRY